MKVTIIYDNEANPCFKSGLGLSCSVEDKEKLQFNTGDSDTNPGLRGVQ